MPRLPSPRECTGADQPSSDMSIYLNGQTWETLIWASERHGKTLKLIVIASIQIRSPAFQAQK
jgi:hypothetical protein